MTWQRGIFCLETVWNDSKDQTSIRPVLELLRDYLGVPFIHRHAVTLDAFEHHVAEWLGEDSKEFPILYLAYHGDAGSLALKDKQHKDKQHKDKRLNLPEIASILREHGGCKNRLVHFASCSTLNVKEDELACFASEIAASAVSGYEKEVDWLASTAFELMYLESLQYAGGKKALTKDVVQSVRDGDGYVWPLFEKSKAQPTGEDLSCVPPLPELGCWLGFQLHIRG